MIFGNNGADALIGGGGNDTMYGLGGDDGYIVDSASDQVIEFAGQGNDTVYTSVSYTLTAGSEIETLTAYDRTATNALVLTGNGFDNVIFGNNGADALIGGGGNDTMYGLGGDDAYIVDSASDQVIEFAGQGNDTVYTSVELRADRGLGDRDADRLRSRHDQRPGPYRQRLRQHDLSAMMAPTR